MPHGKLREIERLRAVAALLTMVVHCAPLQKLLPSILQNPWSGVDLFFVISGFVVTLSLVRLLPPLEGETSFVAALHRSKPAFKTFYVRRFFRIMPLALAVVLIQRTLTGVFPAEFGTAHDWTQEFFAFISGVYNYFQAFHTGVRLNVYWSLAVEEHFYLLLPMLFVVMRTTNRRLLGCAALALFSILARALPAPTTDGAYETMCSHLRFDSLMAGVVLALVRDASNAAPIMPRAAMRWLILPMVLAGVACIPGTLPPQSVHGAGFIALWMLSGLLVAHAARDQGYILPVPVLGRVLEYLGGRSYAIYLVHMVVARLERSVRDLWPWYADFAPDSTHPWQRVAVFVAGTFIAAEVLYRVVEQPFIRMGRRLIEHPGGYALSRRTKGLLAAGVALLAVVYFRHGILRLVGPRDLALHAAVTASSYPPKGAPQPEALTDGELESEDGLRTNLQPRPWVAIDLGVPTPMGAVRIYDCDDNALDQQVPLELGVSNDGVSYTVVARRERVFTQALPWRIRMAEPPARYVRLLAERDTALCLSEVEIYASERMAAIP